MEILWPFTGEKKKESNLDLQKQLVGRTISSICFLLLFGFTDEVAEWSGQGYSSGWLS